MNISMESHHENYLGWLPLNDAKFRIHALWRAIQWPDRNRI